MAQYASYQFPWGCVTVGYEEDAVIFLKCTDTPHPESLPSPVSELAAAQLGAYFEGNRKAFTFPCHPRGTEFQLAVWEELRKIPYGETRTYGQIATAIGKPKAARAVGMACNKNPIWIAIPCHRVVGNNNSLTGYAGGLDLKQKLLQLEQHP